MEKRDFSSSRPIAGVHWSGKRRRFISRPMPRMRYSTKLVPLKATTPIGTTRRRLKPCAVTVRPPPIAKYWACKRAPGFVAEALECHGGNGFIAEHLIERPYREAPLNGIWEGTGNVVCLDVLRAIRHEPATVGVLLAEIRLARGAGHGLDAFRGRTRTSSAPPRRVRSDRPAAGRNDGPCPSGFAAAEPLHGRRCGRVLCGPARRRLGMPLGRCQRASMRGASSIALVTVSARDRRDPCLPRASGSDAPPDGGSQPPRARPSGRGLQRHPGKLRTTPFAAVNDRISFGSLLRSRGFNQHPAATTGARHDQIWLGGGRGDPAVHETLPSPMDLVFQRWQGYESSVFVQRTQNRQAVGSSHERGSGNCMLPRLTAVCSSGEMPRNDRMELDQALGPAAVNVVA